MKGNGGILVIVVGLLILWLGITGKFDCFAGSLSCMLGDPNGSAAPGGGAAETSAVTGGALDRVTSRLGPSYRLPTLDGVLSGRTPPFLPEYG